MLSGLPTDNLYKFISLSGLVILLASLYYYEIFNDQYRTELAELGKVNNLADLEIRNAEAAMKETEKYYDKRLKTLEELIKVIEERVSPYDLRRNDIEVFYDYKYYKPIELGAFINEKIIKTEIEVDNSIVKKNKAIREMELMVFEATRKQNLIVIKESNLKRISIISAIGYFIGIALMIFGFSAWYKIQKLQDQVLINEAKTRFRK